MRIEATNGRPDPGCEQLRWSATTKGRSPATTPTISDGGSWRADRRTSSRTASSDWRLHWDLPSYYSTSSHSAYDCSLGTLIVAYLFPPATPVCISFGQIFPMPD